MLQENDTYIMSFFDKIENRFDFLYEKYKNDIKMINEFIELKKLLIDDFNLIKLDKSDEIANAITVKHFNIDCDGYISII